MSSERESDALPFRDRLIETSFDTDPGKILSFERDNDTLVRSVSISELVEDINFRDLNIDEAEYVRRGKVAIEELQSYGIKTPNHRLVWGESKSGERCLFTLVKRIDGIGILDADYLNPSANFIQSASSLYENLAHYYSDKYKNGGDYLDDTKDSHFMYGSQAGDLVPQMYMVDLDMRFSYFNNELKDSPSNQEFYSRLGFFSSMVANFEEKSSVDLKSAKSLLEEIIADSNFPKNEIKIRNKISQNLHLSNN